MSTAPFAALALAALLALGGCAAPAGSGAAGAPSAMPPSAAALPDSAEETEERRRARIRLELAATYYQQGNVAVALQELRQALTIDPNYAQAHGMLGLVNMGLGDTQRAETAFTRALALAPNDAEINNNYGWFLCTSGRQRESIEFFRRALADPLYRTPSKPLHNAGVCSLAVGSYAASRRWA